MKEQIVAKAYAKAIVELGEKQNVDVAKELTSFWELITENDDLENLLFIDVFTVEEKLDVVNTVLEKLGTNQIVKSFMAFLIAEKRVSLLPSIYKDIIVLDDHKKGFLKGTIEGSVIDADPAFVEKVKSYLKEKLGKDIEFTYNKSEKITAGYKVTVDDLQLDASLDNQLNKFKDSILNG